VLAPQLTLNIAVRERLPPLRGRRVSSTYCTHRALTGAVFFAKKKAQIKITVAFNLGQLRSSRRKSSAIQRPL
jgi:hypothetical protein